MQLMADRFAAHEDGRVFDLSTGALVTLMIGSAGGVSEQLRWVERCDVLRTLHHPAVATLVDYGLFGASSRFEAWGCGGALLRCDEGKALHACATRWLRACGRSAAAYRPGSIRFDSGGREVWLPETGTGYPEEPLDASAPLPIDDRGLQIVERPIVTILAEMFQAADARPNVSLLWGPHGSGKGVVVGELARLARTAGYVPIAASLISSPQMELWQGRSLFVIADAAQEGVWQAFLSASLKDAQRHVLLLVGEHEHRHIAGVGVGRLSVDELTSAIRPRMVDRRLAQRARRAADRSQGLPGRFARLLWPDWITQYQPRSAAVRTRVSRVAEQQAVYGRPETADQLLNARPTACAWPAPGELAAFRRRMDYAIDDLARGRHAPGIRQLRQVVGSLARRGAWADASRGARSLTGALLRRGRPREALATATEGRDYATRAGDEPALVDLAVTGGNARIDLGRFDEAESVLGAALVVARALREPDRIAAVSLALARASYWRGAYADAEVLLAVEAGAPCLRIRRSLIAARIAVAQGDPARAMSVATAAVSEANEAGDLTSRASAAWVIALVHFAVGDFGAVEHDLSEALAVAREARDPQRVIRIRLLCAEVERTRGRPAMVAAHLEHLRRLVAAAPAIVRARWDLATALSATEYRWPEAIARHVKASGFASLGIYVARCQSFSGSICRLGPDADATALDGVHGPSRGIETFIEELVGILRVCQTAADEVDLLKDVSGRLRQHLHAAAVAFVAVRGGLTNIVASTGSRLDAEIAERAAASGTTIPPHCHHHRVEAAAPIVYGGEPIGAVCARWPIGSTYDNSRAASVLTMSAAAAAPILAAIAARNVQGAEGVGELLGITPAMVALRQSVARAAAAPFGVLVEGESGSGKELVARAIHRGSARRNKPFCTLNCAALPDDLVEAELFGHARGAFTGAVGDRAGVFEEAHGGTLFLDEIGELTPRAQAKVLRVVQEGELRRVGENVTRRVDVRIVSATNRALRHEVDAGRFRLDLLYRLDVVHITVPTLRDRREDIALLAEQFWRDAIGRVGSSATLGASTLAALARHDWPGNVRELQNVLAALAVRTPKRGVVPPSALPPQFGERGAAERWSLDEARRTFEVSFVRAALVRTGGHRGRAAAELGVTRQGLTKLMNRLGIGG
jgi:DNA-binding NtrC family response regulator